MSFCRLKVEYVDKVTINKHLAFCCNNRLIQFRKRELFEEVSLNAFIEDKEVNFNLTYRDNAGVTCTYIFKKDGNTQGQTIQGIEAYRVMSKYYHVPSYKDDEEVMEMSASPLLWRNMKYDGTRHSNVIGYDMNSAYGFGLLADMPNTKDGYTAGYVKDGEIGFIEMPKVNDHNNVVMSLTPIYTGFAKYKFPLMESPFKKFVETWYNKKLAGERKAKQVINYAVGYLQRINPFLRATVIGCCNSLIESMIDANTLYCNTDSIITLKPITSLVIGKNIGEWKIEKKGDFAFRNFNYQWNKEAPHYRGKSRNWFKDGFDILVDRVPNEGNEYKFNWDKMRIEKYKPDPKELELEEQEAADDEI